MAYKKRYTRKTYKPKPKSTSMVTRGASAINTAYRAYTLASKVARMVNVEYKYYDYQVAADSISSTGYVDNIFQPDQGVTVVERQGDSCKPMRTSGRVTFTMHPSATTTQVRCILFRGKQENGVSYSVGNLLEYVSTLSPKNDSDRFRTKIFHDKTYILNTNRPNINLNWNYKQYGHVNFVTGATTIENGGIYILLISDQATNTPTIGTVLRTTFTDN